MAHRFDGVDQAKMVVETQLAVFKATYGEAWGMNGSSKNEEKEGPDPADAFLAPLEIGMNEVIKKAVP
jgi:hypothetical protein